MRTAASPRKPARADPDDTYRRAARRPRRAAAATPPSTGRRPPASTTSTSRFHGPNCQSPMGRSVSTAALCTTNRGTPRWSIAAAAASRTDAALAKSTVSGRMSPPFPRTPAAKAEQRVRVIVEQHHRLAAPAQLPGHGVAEALGVPGDDRPITRHRAALSHGSPTGRPASPAGTPHVFRPVVPLSTSFAIRTSSSLTHPLRTKSSSSCRQPVSMR